MLFNLIISIALFFLVFFIQVFIWNFKKIKKEILILLYIYIPPLFLIISLHWYLNLIILDILIISFLYILLSLSYLQTYPALRENIPSFTILLIVEKAGKKGISKENLKKELYKDNLLTSKYKDLINDGMIFLNSDGYLRLSFFSCLLLRFFSFYRWSLGLETGDG